MFGSPGREDLLSNPAPSRSLSPRIVDVFTNTLGRGVCSISRLTYNARAVAGAYGSPTSASTGTLSRLDCRTGSPTKLNPPCPTTSPTSREYHFTKRKVLSETPIGFSPSYPNSTAGLLLRRYARVASLEFVLRVVMKASLYKRVASGSSGCLPVVTPSTPWFIATKAASRRI